MANGKQKSKNRSTQKCPLMHGTIVIKVVRDDTEKLIGGAKISLKGPTPGSATSATSDFAMFYDRAIGKYSFTATLPEHYVVLAHTNTLSIAGDDIDVGIVRAYPTGTLNVKVIRDDTNAEITEKCTIYSVSGPESLTWDKSASNAFKKIRCGQYMVSARIPEDVYEPLAPEKDPKATVPENGSASAVIVVTPKAWIRIRVHDKDAKDVQKIHIKLKPAGASPLTGLTDAGGSHQFNVSKKQTTCDLQELVSDDDVLYEVVDVVSA